MFYSFDDIPQTLHTLPKRFDARIAVALSAEETAEHGDLTNHFANRRYSFGNRLLRLNVSPFPFCLGKKQTGLKIRMGLPLFDQSGQAPGNYQIDCQSQFQLGHTGQLQRLDPATVLQHMEESLNLPAAAIPVNQFDDRLKALGCTVRQQAPLNRIAIRRCIDLLSNQSGHRQQTTLAILQIDFAGKNLLLNLPSCLSLTHRHLKFNAAQGCAGKNGRPQFATIRQTTVMLRANQPICRRTELMRALHQAKNVDLSVGDLNLAVFWHLKRRLANLLKAINPALAFKHAWAFAIKALGFACPLPGVSDSERLPVRDNGTDWMNVHATLGFVGEWAKSQGFLPVEIKFGRVLQTQNHRMLAHPGFGSLNMRCQNILSAQFPLLLTRLFEEAIGCLRLRPVRTRPWNACCRFVSKPRGHLHQPLIQPIVTQCCARKLFHRPRLHLCLFIEKTIGEQKVEQLAAVNEEK